MAIEEPAHKVLIREGAFEVRQYVPMAVAEVLVPGDRDEAANRGFRLLAGYIFGGNQPAAKIAMTAPVLQQPVNEITVPAPARARSGEKIAMTAPVLQTATEAGWRVRFVMPAGATLANLPKPNDDRVRLLEEPGAKVAAFRFSGTWNDAGLKQKAGELEAFIARQGLKPAGAASFAFYNPPWTLPFMRRNEVLIPVE